MFQIIENNLENIMNGTENYDCSDDIYGILLNTGRYINAKDIIFLTVKISFI